MSGKTIINYNIFVEKYFPWVFPEFEKFHQNSLSFPGFPWVPSKTAVFQVFQVCLNPVLQSGQSHFRFGLNILIVHKSDETFFIWTRKWFSRFVPFTINIVLIWIIFSCGTHATLEKHLPTSSGSIATLKMYILTFINNIYLKANRYLELFFLYDLCLSKVTIFSVTDIHLGLHLIEIWMRFSEVYVVILSS